MSTRALFVLAGIILLLSGLVMQAQDAASARSQSAAITRLDQSGSSTAAALANLKAFVSSHMGTSLTVDLTGSYDRKQAAAAASTKAVAAFQQANAQVYADAQRACMGKTDSITQARCNTAYLQSHLTASSPPSPIPSPKLADYEIPLSAPFWTPDLAGALMLGGTAAIVVGFFLKRRRG